MAISPLWRYRTEIAAWRMEHLAELGGWLQCDGKSPETLVF
jgi:hypothetical protein